MNESSVGGLLRRMRQALLRRISDPSALPPPSNAACTFLGPSDSDAHRDSYADEHSQPDEYADAPPVQVVADLNGLASLAL